MLFFIAGYIKQYNNKTIKQKKKIKKGQRKEYTYTYRDIEIRDKSCVSKLK